MDKKVWVSLGLGGLGVVGWEGGYMFVECV